MNEENKNDPPYEIKGNGNPFTGINPAAMEQLMNTCARKMLAIPIIINPENLSNAE